MEEVPSASMDAAAIKSLSTRACARSTEKQGSASKQDVRISLRAKDYVSCME
jgi:hypothetical protein